uniref:Ataxin 7-like 2a n=1 Tax=Maylandia zebra TaxID=106582 RepID=A0A3P9DGL1_9CICH
MAALDRRVPSLDDFVGQSWTAWADWAGMTPADGPDVDDCNKNGKKAAEAMSLSKEGKHVHLGLYPGHDDFYLVVCSHCGQVVKPQAFESTASGDTGCGQAVRRYALHPDRNPNREASRPLSSSWTNAASWEGRNQGVGQLRAAPPSPVTPPQYRYSKTSKDGSAPPLEPPMSSPPPSLRDPPWPHGATPPGRSSPSDSIQSVPSHRPAQIHSKHTIDLSFPQIHSIHQRRKVVELKTRVREKGSPALEGGSSTGQSLSPEAPREQAGTPHCRRPLVTLPAFRTLLEINNHLFTDYIPSPLVHGRISSDESEAEGNDERAEFPSSAAHPRPAAVCSFGSRVLGQGIYTFDRRLHHLRSAFSSMLEQHISAHLWKKIPQAADLQSPPPPAKTITSVSPTIMSSSSSHSKVRTGSHISSSLKTASSSSSSSRGPGRPPTSTQLENYGSNSSSSIAGSHGRPKNPVGRPSKQMLKLREQVATAAVLRKRKVPSQEGEHSGPDRNCIVLQDRGRPPSNTSSLSSKAHAQTNGTLSPSRCCQSDSLYRATSSVPHSACRGIMFLHRRSSVLLTC